MTPTGGVLAAGDRVAWLAVESGAHRRAVRAVGRGGPPGTLLVAVRRVADEVAQRLDREPGWRARAAGDRDGAVELACPSGTGPRAVLHLEEDGSVLATEVGCPADDPWARCAPAVAELLGEFTGALLTDPDRDPAGPDGLSARTRATVLAPPTRPGAPYRSVPERIWDAAGAHPERPAVHHAGSMLTYRQLVAAAADLADRLPDVPAIGWDFRPGTLHWAPADRAEFAVHRRWHLDTITSSGFTAPPKAFARTTDNDAVLAGYLRHHEPFYRALRRHALAPVPATATEAP